MMRVVVGAGVGLALLLSLMGNLGAWHAAGAADGVGKLPSGGQTAGGPTATELVPVMDPSAGPWPTPRIATGGGPSTEGHVPDERFAIDTADRVTLLEPIQTFEIRPAAVQPVVAFTLRDDGVLAPTDEFSAGGNSRVALEDPGRLLAQGQPPSAAQDEAEREAGLAKQLANPISSLISVPFQSNFNFGIGPTQGGFQYLLNIQPVYPVSMNEAWNFITRMILPVVYQNQIFPGAGSQFGLGDTTFQFFFSPKAPTKGGIIWGVGPTLFVPSGTDPLLSARTWGAGIDGVVLTQIPQKGGVFTAGLLATQTWSFAGPATINSLFLQPFFAFTFPNTVTINLQTQSTLNWNTGQWTVPIIASVSKIFKFGDQLTSIGLGAKYYPVSPVGAPTWGLQATVTLLFPAR